MPTATPIFVISYNRGAWLAKVADAYRRQSLPVEIVVHDNGSGRSRHPSHARRARPGWGGRGPQPPNRHRRRPERRRPDRAGLFRRPAGAGPLCGDRLRRGPVRRAAGGAGGLSRVAGTVPGRRLRRADAQDLRHPQKLSAVQPGHEPAHRPVLGAQPGLDHDQLRRRGLRPRADRHHPSPLHRAGEAFRRKKRGLRVYHPYEARHLDWYPGPETSEAYHRTSSPQISHWNNAEHQGVHAGDPLEAHSYVVVESDAMGNLLTRLKQPLIHNPR
ncbi:MAG: hypothetical protein WDM92_00285 [Caulobacteraceae bacterium]